MTDSATPDAVPSPLEIRAELHDLIQADLLGPKGGPVEEIDESRVSDRYLVGLLAPREQRVGQERDEGFETSNESEDSDDGSSDPASNRVGSILPSSFGMTFTVDLGIHELEVEATWGKYDKAASETLKTKEGDPKQVWHRIPRGGTIMIPMQAGAIAPLVVDHEEPDVHVRGVVRERDGTWIVTLFLVNAQKIEKKTVNKDRYWLFQAELKVQSPIVQSPFLRRQKVLAKGLDHDELYREDRELHMLYRREQEFAVGHGVAATWEVDPEDPWRAKSVRTSALPRYEVRQQTPPTSLEEGFGGLADVELRMDSLSRLDSGGLADALLPLVDSYDRWIDAEAEKCSDPNERLKEFEDAPEAIIERLRSTAQRIRDGIELLRRDEQAAESFRFANRAMWLQRVHSIYSLGRRRSPDDHATLQEIDAEPKNKSWRPFQLAFILLNLPSVTDLHHQDRSHETHAIADLLWFPTGGGKTEAYLGLAAYTMGLRRLQGIVEGRDGRSGVSVLMRYTLRLLTLQQFQRATALLCAMEVIRREAVDSGDPKWGGHDSPFSIGLWVGASSTPNWTRASEEVVRALKSKDAYSVATKGSPRQLTNCPWCGTPIKPRNLEVESFGKGRARTFTFCDRAACAFSSRSTSSLSSPGLPVLVVDEEIYRRLPTLLIATVDKFAQLPWNGLTEMLFGRVDGQCPRHGFRSPDIEDKDSHRASGRLPAVRSEPHADLRPPDLIIQDELHLISGPLGSMVGLYETAIDELCSWEVDGRKVRPKVVASTATVRNASSQIWSLFCRRTNVFPAPGLDASNNFFSKRREVGPDTPGRLYLGICAPGRSLKAALIRTFVAYLSAGQTLYEKYDIAADPWMTAVGYFNSLRELGGMRRMLDEDVRNRLRHMDQRGLSRRVIHLLEELTSRKQSTDIPEILDRLERGFSQADDQRRIELAKARSDESIPRAIDVLLATSMISVGVDIDRLGLMVVGGQPKSTSEYIQATSRVGRKHPGVVCTVYNWARPRDLSHFERFHHYHATFYQHVEALSVTPFAARAVDRGIAALLVSLIRHETHSLNPNDSAGAIDGNPAFSVQAVEAICRRIHTVTGSNSITQDARARLKHLSDHWKHQASTKKASLVYKSTGQDGDVVGLLRQAEAGDRDAFTCLNSLRDVEQSAKLVLVEDATAPRTPGGTL